MYKLLGLATGLLLAAPGVMRAQDHAASPDSAAPAPVRLQTVAGLISAVLPSGATLRGSGATVYLWVDGPELHGALDAACTAARARPNEWIQARTELESPSGMQLDSAVAGDLALLQRVVAIPHAVVHADSAGQFVLEGVPLGDYWIEAEMAQGSGIVQWWHKLSLDAASLMVARILSKGHPHTASMLAVGTQDFTRNQFCTGGEQPLGAAEFATGQRTRQPTYVAEDSAYENVDVPAQLLDSVKPKYPSTLLQAWHDGTVKATFVIDTDGHVDMHHVRILSSPDPQFSDAVRDALSHKFYRPARIDGRPVRSVASEEFIFSLVHSDVK